MKYRDKNEFVGFDLELLSPRERQVIELIYGINGPPKKAIDVATELGVSKQMISQWVSSARRKLRDELSEPLNTSTAFMQTVQDIMAAVGEGTNPTLNAIAIGKLMVLLSFCDRSKAKV
mgnify:CR=1 FL=1